MLDDFVAGGASVSMSAYVVHHQDSICKDHDTYKPERWLGEEGKSLQPFFVSFSAGARGCIGGVISYLEQTVLIASLVHRYEVALPSPDWDPVIKDMEAEGDLRRDMSGMIFGLFFKESSEINYFQ